MQRGKRMRNRRILKKKENLLRLKELQEEGGYNVIAINEYLQKFCVFFNSHLNQISYDFVLIMLPT